MRSGPYRFTRNPMYLGMTTALTGVAILLGTLTPFLLIPLFAAWIDFRFISREETMLVGTFGEEYERFRREVRRWI